MNKRIIKIAESLDTVHTHTHTHTSIIYQSIFTNKAQYVSETCNKMQVKFNMQKYKARIILSKKVLF